MRTERDSLGEITVPDDAWYGPHTARSTENFTAAGRRLPTELVHAMARLKKACATANHQLGRLDTGKRDAIHAAVDRVRSGHLDEHFVVDVFQAGSGTSSHMNVNEVLANLAAVELGGVRGDRDRVHPNDDVNQGQSTNNVFPSAIRLVVVEQTPGLIVEVTALADAFRERGQRFSEVIKSGRTHLQDAVPLRVEQQMTAWARALEKAVFRLEAAAENCRELGVGGNAIGTGVNTPAGFRRAIIEALNAETGETYRPAEDGVELTRFLTDLAAASAAMRLLAQDLHQISNDLRLLASGPRTGLGELILPAVEPGSSIMPGKINPSICEAVNMACLQVMGLDTAVAQASAAGQLELNTHMPLVGTNLVDELGILTRTCRMFREKCVTGLEVDEAICRKHFERSAGLPTILNPVLGYDRVAELVKESLRTGKTLPELVREQGLLEDEELQQLLDGSTGPRA